MEVFFVIIIIVLIAFFVFRNSDSVKMKDDSAGEFLISGKTLECHHCKNTRFYPGKSQLNTLTATLLGFDWANREASFFSCENCGYMHWFRREPSQIEKWRK